jgi:hypothetical protein
VPDYDDNDQYIGQCSVNGVPHHITVFRVVGEDHAQEAATGHESRMDALRAFEGTWGGFMAITIDGRGYLCVITPHSL